MAKISQDTRLPFGKHKGLRVRECPPAYIRWMAFNLRDTDFHEYAVVAYDLINSGEYDNADCDADEFLRSRGIDPRDFK